MTRYATLMAIQGTPLGDFLSELADALGHVRREDGAPYVMTPEEALEMVRELRAERDELREELPELPH